MKSKSATTRILNRATGPQSWTFIHENTTSTVQLKQIIINLRQKIRIGICKGAAMGEPIWKGQSTGVWKALRDTSKNTIFLHVKISANQKSGNLI